jgi:hypothetical protein
MENLLHDSKEMMNVIIKKYIRLNYPSIIHSETEIVAFERSSKTHRAEIKREIKAA